MTHIMVLNRCLVTTHSCPHSSPLVKVGNPGQWSKTRQPRNHSDLRLKVEVGLRYLGMRYDTKAEAVKISEIKHIRSQPDIVIPRPKGGWYPSCSCANSVIIYISPN
jgi:hypothetical protein